MVFREEVVLTDPEAVGVLCQQIGLRAAAGSEDPGFSYRLSQAGDEQVTISEAALNGALSFRGGTEVFAVSQALGARYDWQIADAAGTVTGVPTLFRPGRQGLVVAERMRSTNVYLPVEQVQATAGTLYGTEAPVAFNSSAPASLSLGRTWSALARYGVEVVGSAAFDEPLVRAQLARHLTVGMLECFQLTGDRQQRYLSIEAQVRRYRVAVQFFDDFASLPITVEDAARAAETTTEMLVRAFRANHPLQLSPAQYLRRTRLAAAHHDLVGADPTAGDTVREIAARWGFAHPGRFAAAYRAVYGVTPRHTLQR
ncbi:helix-turn-helix transcriptional regulator [Kocuria arenosa]|uniref:helix-turn-helix transcriptional regulator n=1 Tax=Kocuria arenosa TaxID=3071446 RepID=UPI0034D6AA12